MDETKVNGNNHGRKKIAIGVFIVIGLIGVISVLLYVNYKRTHITTDDAFVEGRIHTISSKVPGTVKNVLVADNQFVKKGDLLVEIDESDYAVLVSEAGSGLHAEQSRLAEFSARAEVAKKQLSELQYRVNAARANLELQEANLRQAETDIKRAENLFKKEAISKERYEKTKTGYEVAVAQVKAAGDQLKQAEASLATQQAVIRQAEASLKAQASSISQKEAVLDSAELKKGYTKLYAPADGYITKKSVETGNHIQAGQPVMAIVPLDDIWVVANYKETQLEKVKLGQKVKIKPDSYPNRVFEGRVDSIMAGTGAVFSLFPAENATGNFVKVVQRIPVKITLEKSTDKEHALRVGMSVVPTIVVEK